MAMWIVWPEVVGPFCVAELVTITAIIGGSDPAGGGDEFPGLALQPVPHAGVVGALAKPLKLAGALPPVNELRLDHCAPQKVTDLPITALLSPITKLPPPGANTIG